MVTLLFFASARERAGIDRVSAPLAGLSVHEALKKICEQYEGLNPLLPHCRFAINGAFVTSDVLLQEEDELALIPPVAGGDHLSAVKIVDVPLSVDEALDFVDRKEAGAQVVMIGTVRNHAEGQGVESLEYEAYGSMAQKVIAAIVVEVEQAFPKSRAYVAHRVGHLNIGERAVVVAVSHPHRKQAFDACQKIIDRLKEDAPIWKREHREGGVLWVGLGP